MNGKLNYSRLMGSTLILTFSLALSACPGQGNIQADGKRGETATEIRAEEIVALLDEGKNIDLNGCIVWGDLDFTKLKNIARISPLVFQTYTNNSLTFVNCVFTGKVSAYSGNPQTGAAVTTVFARNLCFVDCDFRDEVNFAECVVESNVFLTGSTFRRSASWQSAYFKHKTVYFTNTVFEGDALFQNTVFAGSVNFLHAKFNASAMFQKAVAAGNMIFGNARFDGYADFTCVSASESIFRYAEFKSRYDFSDAKINMEKDSDIKN